MIRRADCAALAPLLGVALYFVLVVNGPGRTDGMVGFDLYYYYYPNMLYALQTVHDGWRGFWWNALLDCGQPFFGNNFAGLLYPANVLWLLLQPDHALKAVIGFNLVVAGVSAYALCRVLGTGMIAALCGALTFQLSNATVGFSMWGPQVSGPYVWMPAAVLGCERILQRPTFGRSVFLSVVLAIALLPGFPQVVLFTYQLIALRVAWEFASGRVATPMRTLACLAAGLALPPLLVAVQFFPAVEWANLSVRHAALKANEMAPDGFLSWVGYRRAVGLRRSAVNPLLLVPSIIAVAGLLKTNTRRYSLFYLAAGLIYFVLAFGPNGLLFEWYAKLPFGTLFRDPDRFMWMPGFCLAVLTALGTEALLSLPDSTGSVHRVLPGVIAAAVAVGFYALPPDGLLLHEVALAGLAVAATALAGAAPRARPWTAMLIVAALLANLFLLHRTTMVRLLPDRAVLYAHKGLFEMIKQQMTPQDRVHLIVFSKDFSLTPKTASLFGIPSVSDYEPAPTRRYAEFLVMMRNGRQMKSLNQFYLRGDPYNLRGFQRRLLDVAAARYVIVATKIDQTPEVIHPRLRLLSRSPRVRLYENPQALPRAFYVPRVEVVGGGPVLLERLAYGTDDLRQLALVEQPPPSGFTGEPDNTATAGAEFIRNHPEHVIIRVVAPAHGFLFLADQYFPGWQATVNGVATPIVAANHLFRLVEVPAGESVVDFRYTPHSVRLGAWVSVLTVLALAGAGVWSWRQRTSHPSPQGL